jgi:hypothetical protein
MRRHRMFYGAHLILRRSRVSGLLHDDRAIFQASSDERPAIDIHSL